MAKFQRDAAQPVTTAIDWNNQLVVVAMSALTCVKGFVYDSLTVINNGLEEVIEVTGCTDQGSQISIRTVLLDDDEGFHVRFEHGGKSFGVQITKANDRDALLRSANIARLLVKNGFPLC